MRVLVYGADGWIGGKVCALLAHHTVVHGTARADSFKDVSAELESVQPTHVVCCVGRTHGLSHPTIDFLELPGNLGVNLRDNLYAPLVLASVCKARTVHLTYLGTGCIFDGDTPYTEDALPNFFGSSYSTVKGYTDRMMHDLFDDCVLNLRIRMPVSSERHPRNFIHKITHYQKICSIPNSITVLDDLLPHLPVLMERKTVGTLNFTNPGVISHNEILAMYKELVDPSFTWENFTLDEQNTILLSKRSNNHLDTTRLEALVQVTPVCDAVRAVLLVYGCATKPKVSIV